MLKGRVLVIAGSDSGGGAGIQADIKTITCLGGFAMTAITALTAQNTLGVQGILPVPPDFIRQQIDSVWNDLGVDAVKIGMLGDMSVIATVADALDAHDPDRVVPLVLDPVMVAKGGDVLLPAAARQALADRLVGRAHIVTPNLPEATALTQMVITNLDQRRQAARALMARGAAAVLMKGGHADGDDMVDMLITRDGEYLYTSQRRLTRHTHGTGCTMASAIAVSLAQGLAVPDAVRRAHAYVQLAIAHAPGFGAGHGPLCHAAADHFDEVAA